MVPEGWKLTSLGEVCDGNLKTGPFGSQLHAHEYVEDGVPVIMPKDLIDCRVNLSTAAKITKERADDLKQHVLKVGDLLFSRRGDVARFALIDDTSSGSLCGTGCLRARPSDTHSFKFLSYFLQKDAVKRWLEQNAVGQTMPNMNTAILFELPLVSASSKAEEEKIARILSTWDQAIEVTEKLLSNSQQQKKALMQQLLTGKKRLPGFSGEWGIETLKHLVTISKGEQLNRNTLSDAGLYPVINGGISPSGYTEEFNRHENTVTISEGGNSCGFVSIQKSKFWCGGHCYSLEKTKLHFTFLYQLLKLNELRIMRLRVGSGLPNIQKKDIEGLKVTLPVDKKEQQKIASVLSAADKEIETLEQKLDCLRQEKKALMQQLLTGKRRVKVDEDELPQKEAVRA